MNVSIKRLVDDHINLRYTLIVLARQIDRCENRDDLICYQDFFRASLKYLCDYPQVYHHPVEDRLVKFLLDRDGSALVLGDDIGRQHRSLERQGAELRSYFEGLCDKDGHCSFAAFKTNLHRFIDFQHEHLGEEEKYFIPLLEKLMSAEDWQAFNSQEREAHPEPAVNEKRGEFASSLLYIAKRARLD